MPKTTLRERNAAANREAVMEAVVELLATTPLDRLTMPMISEAAGLSLRTLYRCYPDRDALEQALGRWVDDRLLRVGLPSSAEEVASQMEEVGPRFEEHLVLLRALVGSSPEGARSPRRAERLAAIEAALAPTTKARPAAERRRLIALVQLLASAPAWLALRDEERLSGEEAGAALGWAIRRLLETASQPQNKKTADHRGKRPSERGKQ